MNAGYATVVNYNYGAGVSGPVHLAFTWNDSITGKFYWNGVPVVANAGGPHDRPGQIGTIDLGYDSQLGAGPDRYWANAVYEDMVFFETCPSDADILALYNSQAPTYQEQKMKLEAEDNWNTGSQGFAANNVWEDDTTADYPIRVPSPSDVLIMGRCTCYRNGGAAHNNYLRVKLTDGSNVWTGDAAPYVRNRNQWEQYANVVFDIIDDIPAGEYTVIIQRQVDGSFGNSKTADMTIAALTIPKAKEDQYR